MTGYLQQITNLDVQYYTERKIISKLIKYENRICWFRQDGWQNG